MKSVSTVQRPDTGDSFAVPSPLQFPIPVGLTAIKKVQIGTMPHPRAVATPNTVEMTVRTREQALSSLMLPEITIWNQGRLG